MADEVERVRRAAEAVAQEAVRRAYGESSDPSLDVPLAMLEDLGEELVAREEAAAEGRADV